MRASPNTQTYCHRRIHKRIGASKALSATIRNRINSVDSPTGMSDRGMADQQTVKERLKTLMEGKGWSENELARRSGVPQPTIHRILTGESKSPRAGNLQKLADALESSSSYLSYGDASSSRTEATSNVQRAPQPIRYHRYPVIGYGQAGAWTEAVAPYPPGAEPHHETTDYCAKGKAFWLEIKGDSMTAPHGGRPSIAEGTLVLFDTGIEAAPGKLVVAQLSDSGEATFKQLIEDGGQRYLKALNPAYPLIPINGNCRILGVAVEAKTRL
ncbi:MAG: LexA family protein [Pseudomonadota bacterium]